jgi:hypothetical protein
MHLKRSASNLECHKRRIASGLFNPGIHIAFGGGLHPKMTGFLADTTDVYPSEHVLTNPSIRIPTLYNPAMETQGPKMF